MNTTGSSLHVLASRSSNWDGWYQFNCDRLNTMLSSDSIYFQPYHHNPKFIEATFHDFTHIFGNFFLDCTTVDDAIALVAPLSDANAKSHQFTSVIPACEDNRDHLSEIFGSRFIICRNEAYRIELFGRSMTDILGSMSQRNRTKIRSSKYSFKIFQGTVTDTSALDFENKQREWRVSKLNFFSAESLLKLSRSINVKQWTLVANGGNLHILILENFPEAYFFLAAPMSDDARDCSLHLHWTIINDLHSRQFSTYYLGGGVSSHEGVARFKRSLGALEYRRLLVVPFGKIPTGPVFPDWFGIVNNQ